MKDLKEAKERALLRIGVCNPQILGLNKGIPQVMSKCFDAGVKAERERVLVYLLSEEYKEEDLMEFLNWHGLVPEKEGGENELSNS
jgi:hypothetical protein